MRRLTIRMSARTFSFLGGTEAALFLSWNESGNTKRLSSTD